MTNEQKEIEFAKLAKVSHAINALILAAEDNGMPIQDMGELVTSMANRRDAKDKKA